jgi:glycosyltransferase involved in cell wall biosynthesis
MRFGIAMIASVFPPSVGGIQTHTLHLCEKLRNRGLEAFVLTRSHPGLPRYEEIGGVPTYRLGFSRGGPAICATSYILECCRHLATHRKQWDVVHAHQMLSPMTVGLLARAALGGKLVVNPHASGQIGDVETLRKRRPLTGRARLAGALKFGDAFVSISAGIRDDLRRLGAEEEKIWDIPNGVDTEHFRPLTRHQRAPLRRALGLPDGWMIVFTGRLAPEKGLDTLLQAWPQVRARRPDAQLLIVGGGERLPTLLAQAGSLAITGSVHFAGECADAAPVLQAADCFVLPSMTEGLPVSLLEAMACGLPVVATSVGGSRQLVEDGVSGGLVAPGDAQALSEKLLAAADPPRGESWGQRARRQVVAMYSLDTVAEKYAELYQHLLGIRASSPAAVARRPAA